MPYHCLTLNSGMVLDSYLTHHLLQGCEEHGQEGRSEGAYTKVWHGNQTPSYQLTNTWPSTKVFEGYFMSGWLQRISQGHRVGERVVVEMPAAFPLVWFNSEATLRLFQCSPGTLSSKPLSFAKGLRQLVSSGSWWYREAEGRSYVRVFLHSFLLPQICLLEFLKWWDKKKKKKISPRSLWKKRYLWISSLRAIGPW